MNLLSFPHHYTLLLLILSISVDNTLSRIYTVIRKGEKHLIKEKNPMRTGPEALIIVDAQRGFMPETEGDRLGLPGFGELGVNGGELIVDRINRLTTAVAQTAGNLVATTQDWHPTETAHFSNEPNYTDTWPVHCVAETPGAELHPDLFVAQQPDLATQFIKGDEACTSPADDDSYTGALAYNPETGVKLPDYLRKNGVEHVFVTGLALGNGADNPLCVDSTARDLRREGFEVTLVTDAAEAVFPENREVCFANLGKLGVSLMTTEEALVRLQVA